MKICIFGAGAIGGLIGAKLAAKGEAEVSLVARGPHLLAMQANGLTLKEKDRENERPRHRDRPSGRARAAGLCHSRAEGAFGAGVLESIKPLLRSGHRRRHCAERPAVVVFLQARRRARGPADRGRRSRAERSGSAIGPERAIGCVVYIAAEIESPGVVRHVECDRLPLGEPSGEKSERVLALAQLLVPAGIRAAVRPDIRNDIWVKLWGNLSFNPISALTGGTLEQIAGDEGTRAVARAMMVEAEAIANALGVKFPIDVDKRIAGAASVGAHKTSMLQDLELGRPMEIDALVTSVQELGRLSGVATPAIDTVLALVRQRATLAGCYSA